MLLNTSLRSSRVRLGFLCLGLFSLTILLGNWVVSNVGLACGPNGPCLIPVWPGIMAPSGVLLAGFALVLRDALQNLLGKGWTIVAIAIGALLSAWLAPAGIVLGSSLAFLFSELADLAVYTPLRERHLTAAIIISGLVGSLVDSVIFLSLAFGSLEYVWGQVLGKFWMSLLGGMVISLWHFRAQRLSFASTSVR